MIWILGTAGVLVLAALYVRLARMNARLEVIERQLPKNGRHAAGAFVLWACTSGTAHAQAPVSPADVVATAAADAWGLPPAARSQARYLSLHNIPLAQREQAISVVSLHCNGLSRESDIVVPVAVGSGLLRIYLSDYDWPASVWDKLADPVFVTQIEAKSEAVPWPGGVWPDDGKHYAAGSFTVRRKVKKAALAPWLGAANAAELANLTQSQCPIVRADWFVWNTAIQADRNPGYYDFIGVKNKKDFDALVGYDEKLQKSARRVELLEAVADSTVTLQPRRIGAFPAISGWYWQTFDSRQSVDEKNPLRILNGGFKFDAQEVFGHLPNGIFAWGLFDDKGVRQDAAPDFIASDATAHGTDRRVHNNLSCVRCHAGSGGVQPVDGWARSLFTGALKLQSPDYEKLKDLRQKYLRDLEGPMEDSRRTYARAIAQATRVSNPAQLAAIITRAVAPIAGGANPAEAAAVIEQAVNGLRPAQAGAAYGDFFAAYDRPVSLERAARDLGVTPEKLTTALKASLLRTGSVDTVAASFLGVKPRGIPVLQYHEVVSTLATLASGYQP